MVKLLADESVEGRIVKYLRSHGVEITYISEIQKGKSDEEVLSLAFEEERVILTNDKDFERLVLSQKLPNHGVVLLRFLTQSTSERIEYLEQANWDVFRDKYVVISERGIKVGTKGNG